MVLRTFIKIYGRVCMVPDCTDFTGFDDNLGGWTEADERLRR